MDEIEPAEPPATGEVESAEADLARRLARYRRRIEGEDRPRSLRLIDRAIADADMKAKEKGN